MKTKMQTKSIQALKTNRWCLVADDGRIAGLDPVSFDCVLLPANSSNIQIWDGRDNEVLKRAFWMKQLGCNLSVIPCAS